MTKPPGRRKAGANLLAIAVEELQMGSHAAQSRDILAVNSVISETSDDAEHVTGTGSRPEDAYGVVLSTPVIVR